MSHYQTYTDDELLRLVRSDDQAAFTALYYRHWEGLYNAAYKRLKDHGLCEQIVQDVFTDLWLRRTQTVIANLGGYLRTAVQYQVYKIVSRKTAGPAFFELFEQIGASGYQADSLIKNKEFTSLVYSWMETLPAKRREIFKMHYLENLSSAEIAARLNLSPKTVRNQLGTSLESFRVRLAQYLSALLF